MGFKEFITEAEDYNRLRERHAAIKAEMKKMTDTGQNLINRDALRFQALAREMGSISYDLDRLKQPKVEDMKPHPDNTLPPEIIMAARHDIRVNKDVYMAISEAAWGTAQNAYTPVDEIVLGRNPKVSKDMLYHIFDQTRSALKQQFGDKMTLYRAIGRQMNKPTTNWATTENYAKQFGPKVTSKEIPVDQILAVNVGLRGNYHELIVLSA